MAGMTSVAHSQDFNGSWSGVLEFGPSSYTIVFNIQQTGDDVAITWDFPDQNAFNLPATATISGNELNVDMPASNASYKGILEGEALNGTFTQHGFDITLNMTRTGEVQDTRPQETAIETDTNKPYRSEDVTFNNGDIIFSGTLTLPDKGRHFPAVVLVAGSGPLDRDEEAFGHKPFLLLADALSRNGFAVLRYDERGVGATIGGDPGAPSEPLATDAMAAAGLGDGDYTLGGRRVRVADGTARLADTGAIAGSTITLADAVRRAVRDLGIPLAAAVRAASTVPAAALRLADVGALLPGRYADLVVLEPDGTLHAVYHRGRPVTGVPASRGQR